MFYVGDPLITDHSHRTHTLAAERRLLRDTSIISRQSFRTLNVALTQVWTEAVDEPRMSGVMSGFEDSWLSSCSQAL